MPRSLVLILMALLMVSSAAVIGLTRGNQPGARTLPPPTVAGWTWFQPEGSSVSVLMPPNPKHAHQEFAKPGGHLVADVYGADQGQLVLMTAITVLNREERPGDDAAVLLGARDKLLADGGQVESESWITVDGRPGRSIVCRFRKDGVDLRYHARFVIDGDRLLVLSATCPKHDADDMLSEAFVESLTFSDTLPR